MLLQAIKNFDNTIINTLYFNRSDFLLNLFFKITYLGSSFFVIFLSVVIISGLIILKKKYTALYFAGALFFTDILIYIVKYLINRARPDSPVAVYLESTPSFPSGHSAMALMLYGLLAVVASLFLKGSRAVLSCLAVFIIILVGFSRIYLGVHYPSDVVGGFLICLPVFLLVVYRIGDLPENKV